jgi:hypothetical protein
MESLIKGYGREKRLGYTGLNYCCKLQLTCKHSTRRSLMEFLNVTRRLGLTLRFVALLGCKWSVHRELLFHSINVFLYIFSYEKNQVGWDQKNLRVQIIGLAAERCFRRMIRTMLPENDCLTSHALTVRSGEVFCRSETTCYSEHEGIRPPIKRKCSLKKVSVLVSTEMIVCHVLSK